MVDIVEATDASFPALVLEAQTPVLVDFWATWCAPCRRLAPMVERLARERRDSLAIVKVDADAESGLCERYGVRGLPTLLVFRNGEIVARQVGIVDYAALEKLTHATANDFRDREARLAELSIVTEAERETALRVIERLRSEAGCSFVSVRRIVTELDPPWVDIAQAGSIERHPDIVRITGEEIGDGYAVAIVQPVEHDRGLETAKQIALEIFAESFPAAYGGVKADWMHVVAQEERSGPFRSV